MEPGSSKNPEEEKLQTLKEEVHEIMKDEKKDYRKKLKALEGMLKSKIYEQEKNVEKYKGMAKENAVLNTISTLKKIWEKAYPEKILPPFASSKLSNHLGLKEILRIAAYMVIYMEVTILFDILNTESLNSRELYVFAKKVEFLKVIYDFSLFDLSQ